MKTLLLALLVVLSSTCLGLRTDGDCSGRGFGPDQYESEQQAETFCLSCFKEAAKKCCGSFLGQALLGTLSCNSLHSQATFGGETSLRCRAGLTTTKCDQSGGGFLGGAVNFTCWQPGPKQTDTLLWICDQPDTAAPTNSGPQPGQLPQ